jgi:hypothetical protein
MAPEAFEIAISDAVLERALARLEGARVPLDFANADWRYGVERGYLEEIVR